MRSLHTQRDGWRTRTVRIYNLRSASAALHHDAMGRMHIILSVSCCKTLDGKHTQCSGHWQATSSTHEGLLF